jgi:hypothetical protein
MCSTAKKRSVQELNARLSRIVYSSRVSAAGMLPGWQLVWIDAAGRRRKPRWSQFEQGKHNILAVAQLVLAGRSYWLTARLPRPPKLGGLLLFGALSLLRPQAGGGVAVWETDPRTPTGIRSDAPIDHQIHSSAELNALFPQ